MKMGIKLLLVLSLGAIAPGAVADVKAPDVKAPDVLVRETAQDVLEDRQA